MFPQSNIPDLAHVIQLAVAPVFLLTALSTMLAVLTNRLSRVVDRTRKLEDFLLCNRAITFCTLTALLICMVIGLLFISELMGFNASLAVAALFIVSMGTFVFALLSFLREIRVASHALESSARNILKMTDDGKS